MDLDAIIFLILYYGIPVLSLAAVGICVLRFVKAKKMQKRYPLTYTGQEIRKRRNALIAASVISGVVISIQIGIAVLIGIALSHM